MFHSAMGAIRDTASELDVGKYEYWEGKREERKSTD